MSNGVERLMLNTQKVFPAKPKPNQLTTTKVFPHTNISSSKMGRDN